jgi:putative ABC transport system substrate-binding protein
MRGARAVERKRPHRIAMVWPSLPVTEMTETGEPLVKALFNELRHLGYVEGGNVLIDRYSGGGRAAYYPDLARDVVRRNPDVIICIGNDVTVAFKVTTTTIPIVATFGLPVESGIVASVARPGGNITGTTVNIEFDQWEKRLQLLHEVVPQATRFGLLETLGLGALGSLTSCLWSQTCPPGFTAVRSPLYHPIDEAEYRRVFATLDQDRAEAIMISEEEENLVKRKLIVELAAKSRLPAIYPYKIFVEVGGLMSYGIDVSDLGQRVADMADQILKGAKPADIPIFQPTKFELAINLKTAKALGLTVPPELVATADEVIE